MTFTAVLFALLGVLAFALVFILGGAFFAIAAIKRLAKQGYVDAGPVRIHGSLEHRHGR